MTLEEQLRRDEGERAKPYTDTVGKLTIGVGRNLTDVGLSQDEIDFLLANDIKRATVSLESHFPWTIALDDARREALINMSFNLGNRLAGFKIFMAMMQAGEYTEASAEMLNSLWAKQVGSRATRLSLQINTGVRQ